MSKLNLGDTVYVKGFRNQGTTTIARFMINKKGGVVLNNPINGLWCWNVKDLVKIKLPKVFNGN